MDFTPTNVCSPTALTQNVFSVQIHRHKIRHVLLHCPLFESGLRNLQTRIFLKAVPFASTFPHALAPRSLLASSLLRVL